MVTVVEQGSNGLRRWGPKSLAASRLTGDGCVCVCVFLPSACFPFELCYLRSRKESNLEHKYT